MGRNKFLIQVRVAERRRSLKKQAVDYLGGKCIKCGYNKCITALHFHHRNPKEKDFGIGGKGKTRSWEKIKTELDKCDLVCANCHSEIHYEQVYKNSLHRLEKAKELKLKLISKKIEHSCDFCNANITTYLSRLKKYKNIFCSKSCKVNFFIKNFNWPDDEELILMFKSLTVEDICKKLKLKKTSVLKKRKEINKKLYDIKQVYKNEYKILSLKKEIVNWPPKNELQSLVWSKPMTKIAEQLNVSDRSIKKKCKREGIQTPPMGYWISNSKKDN